MPAIKQRLPIRAPNFIATSGLYKDIVIPFGDVMIAASAISGMTASLAMAAPAACGPAFLRWTGTSSGCAVTLQVPIPQDIATALPAAASGTIYLDWLNASGNGKVAIIGACFGYLPSGSEWVTGGPCNLLAASGTCATLTGGSVNQINSSSVVQFKVPTTRNGTFILRLKISGQDDSHTSGSDFHLQDIRLRYLADRIGS